ncbi:nitrite reductase (NADH) large subunit [Microlunatus sagamiharensis]|uniref:assimilatory sulfite reductase (ferredoxin) n=1 Tax=Microlunatus sagamiharensis TaxID=546874 RepID=A0A1H2M8H4_9ACTN|nr:nitrite reductase large subunit NirB [Microlunatus sagamiharensis]SDU89238.1 nitrite reductase (NADH) large subunit [Microlunatus sagamiharensis]
MTLIDDRPAADADDRPRKRRLVVVGNGMAGARTVEEILARGGADLFDITMFGDEPYGNYNRIMLSHVLSGEESDDDIYLNSWEWYAENHIDLHAPVRVERVDRHAKVVLTDDGRAFGYDDLVIATGSRSFMPPMDGLTTTGGTTLPGVFAFRTIDDTRAMIAHAAHDDHRKAVVIGGGLLGLEAARGLQTYGLDVTVVHSPKHLMNAQLGPEGGEILRQSMEALGIHVVCGNRATHVWGPDRVRGLRLKDGAELECDLVVVAAGIRPNTEVAVLSGLAVERAIVVDDHMRVQDEDDVYAVGECVQHRGEVYGLVAPLWEQAAVLADQVTGANPDAAYLGSRTATKLKVAGVEVASMGLTSPERETDEHIVFSEPRRGVFKSIVIRDDKIVGATLLGDSSKVAFLQQAFDRGLPLPEQRVELMFDLGGPSAEVGVAELADDAQVCNCNGVSKGQICGVVRSGVKTVTGVMDATRAGKGCGSCKLLVKQVAEHAAGGAVEEDPSVHYYVPGIPMGKPALMEAIREQDLRSPSAVFTALAPGGAEDAKSKMGLASLLKMMWGEDMVDEKDARFINDRVHANIQKDGTFSVVPQMRGGVTTPEQLRRIADVADKYSVPMVKLTGGQRIDLLGIRKEDLPKVWADLDMPSGYAYGKSMRTVKTCVGQEFCRFGTGDSTKLGVELETRLQGMESPAKMKLAVSGCPRNCAESLVKDVGIVAIEGGRWEIYVGGAAGAHIRKGDLLCTVDDPETAKRLTGRFLQYYRENAKWLERTYAFVPRIGLEEVRAVVVDDRDGIAERLDAAVQEHADRHVDPWSEGRAPVEPGQFRTSLPLEVLPRVPAGRADELLGGSW